MLAEPRVNVHLSGLQNLRLAGPQLLHAQIYMTVSTQAAIFAMMLMKQAELLFPCFPQHTCQHHRRAQCQTEQPRETVEVYLLLRQSALKLILLEGVLDDILHVLAGVFQSAHEIEQGVVTELEGTQKRRRLASHNFPAPHSRHSLDSSSLQLICKPYPGSMHHT